MRVAILDAFSGIAGDMTLGALVQVGLDADWLRDLPRALALDGVTANIRPLMRCGITCQKVDFDIPPQPHGRHLREIRALVGRAPVSDRAKTLADQVFLALATVEGQIHGVSPERVHLHEVGAVDAILDVVGVVCGLERLGIERVYCGAISVGDGTVKAAHGELPVPAPATLKLLEGHEIRPGPAGSGELVTPTGAALVKVLSSGPPPERFVPLCSGFGAGTKEFRDRPNALRIVIANAATGGDGASDDLVELVCDIDDMSPEYLTAAASNIRDAGALDLTLLPVTMKRGRPGTRLELLCRPHQASELEDLLLTQTTTIGVRRRSVTRRALPRQDVSVPVLGHDIRAKVVTLPDGTCRAKPEFVDVERVALATGRPLQDISRLAAAEAERRANG